MSARLRTLLPLAVLALVAVPAAAQEEHEHDEAMHEMHMAQMGSVMSDLLSDVEEVKGKIVGLAQAIPADAYGWRPGDGVRSVSEVFRHIAADNYFLPAPLGFAAPASTGIQPDSYATVQAFEQRDMSREQVIEVVTASFDHVLDAMRATDGAALGESVVVFGRDFTRQGVWVMAVTHLHEHLGQLIAYARTNDVVPPWSM